MNFSEALDECKAGAKISRRGWHAANQYIVYQPGYPEGIAINYNTATATGIKEGTVCEFAPYLLFFSKEGSFVPWVASQTDLLAEDWEGYYPNL